MRAYHRHDHTFTRLLVGAVAVVTASLAVLHLTGCGCVDMHDHACVDATYSGADDGDGPPQFDPTPCARLLFIDLNPGGGTAAARAVVVDALRCDADQTDLRVTVDRPQIATIYADLPTVPAGACAMVGGDRTHWGDEWAPLVTPDGYWPEWTARLLDDDGDAIDEVFAPADVLDYGKPAAPIQALRVDGDGGWHLDSTYGGWCGTWETLP